mgnify:CR=1 FL=1
MKKKIAILGSTGSIGKTLLDIVNQNKNLIEVSLLTAHKDYQTLIKQAKKYSVKNLIITDKESFKKIKKKKLNNKIKIFNNFDCLNKILNKKIDYSMSSIVGINGLEPTLKIIKYSKVIAIANKESIICGWSLILKELNKNKTKFIPVDSEHFSIYSLINSVNKKEINKIYITASGGPFLNFPKKKFFKIKPSQALKHPNWKMGKKITIDSATLMNKVFEVIEAKNIFNIDYDKISILTHPKSYLHAIVNFKNGLVKLLMHEPDMKIPILNSIYDSILKDNSSKSINLEIINNLNLKPIDLEKFPLVKILKNLPKNNSLYETVLITVNDFFVYKFLEKKIDFNKLIKFISIFSSLKEFQKYKRIRPKNAHEIYKLRDYVSLKLSSLGI